MKKYISCLLLIFFFVISYQKVEAGDSLDSFSVNLKLPTYQIGDNGSYFNLRMAPGETTQIEMEISNEEATPQIFVADIHQAATNANGIVDYTIEEGVLVGDFPVDLLSMLDASSKEIEIPAKSKGKVVFNLRMPEKRFDGVVLGGVQVRKKKVEKQQEFINHEVQFTVAIQLSQTDKRVTAELKAMNAEMNWVDYQNAAFMTIQNTQAVLLKNIKATHRVYKQDETEPFITTTQENLSFAPNSEFSLYVLLNDKVTPGVYRYEIDLENTSHIWQLSQTLTVGDKEAKKLNEESVEDNRENNTSLKICVGILFMTVLLLIVRLVVVYKK